MKTIRALGVVDALTEIKSEHFIITYHGIYKDEAEEVAMVLEANYERIRTNLKDPEHDIINVFIHPTQEDFNRGTGLINSSANGTSRGPLEFHFLWTNWYNSIFPDNPVKTAIHEFTHCVQLNILIKGAMETMGDYEEENFNREFERIFMEKYPQWFWEAVCIYEAEEVNRLSVYYGMWNKPSLSSLDPSNQIYNVGYTIIEYIVEKYGKDKIPVLITSYMDIEGVLGVSAEEFEKGWHKFVEEKY